MNGLLTIEGLKASEYYPLSDPSVSIKIIPYFLSHYPDWVIPEAMLESIQADIINYLDFRTSVIKMQDKKLEELLTVPGNLPRAIYDESGNLHNYIRDLKARVIPELEELFLEFPSICGLYFKTLKPFLPTDITNALLKSVGSNIGEAFDCVRKTSVQNPYFETLYLKGVGMFKTNTFSWVDQFNQKYRNYLSSDEYNKPNPIVDIMHMGFLVQGDWEFYEDLETVIHSSLSHFSMSIMWKINSSIVTCLGRAFLRIYLHARKTVNRGPAKSFKRGDRPVIKDLVSSYFRVHLHNFDTGFLISIFSSLFNSIYYLNRPNSIRSQFVEAMEYALEMSINKYPEYTDNNWKSSKHYESNFLNTLNKGELNI